MFEGRIRVGGLWKIVHTEYEDSELIPGGRCSDGPAPGITSWDKRCGFPRELRPGIFVDPVKKCTSRSNDGVTFE